MQQDLADRFGVHIESIKNWERGATKPTIRHIPKIIAFLGRNPEAEPATGAGRIAHARRRLGLTQKELARAIGTDAVTLYRWEKGLTAPDARALQRISELLQEGAVTPR